MNLEKRLKKLPHWTLAHTLSLSLTHTNTHTHTHTTPTTHTHTQTQHHTHSDNNTHTHRATHNKHKAGAFLLPKGNPHVPEQAIQHQSILPSVTNITLKSNLT